MKLLQKIKLLFKKEVVDKKINWDNIKIGKLVELEYCNPNEIGIVSENTLTFTRLNKDEIKNRIIQGTIERINWNEKLNCNVVSFKSIKMYNGESKIRNYLFLDYEIKTIRELR